MTEFDKMKAELKKLQKKGDDKAHNIQAEISMYQTRYQEFKRNNKWLTAEMWDAMYRLFPRKPTGRLDLVQAKRDWREYRDDLDCKPFDKSIAEDMIGYYSGKGKKK